MIHRLKTREDFWDRIADGTKTAELRSTADRDFQVGDILMLFRGTNIYKPSVQVIRARVTHVLSGPTYGLAEGWAMLSFVTEASDARD